LGSVFHEKPTAYQLVKRSPPFVESEGLLEYSQEPATYPYPESLGRTLSEIFPNGWKHDMFFYGEQMLGPRPNHKARGTSLIGCPRPLI